MFALSPLTATFDEQNSYSILISLRQQTDQFLLEDVSNIDGQNVVEQLRMFYLEFVELFHLHDKIYNVY